MIVLNNMLMIGAAASNVGKTLLACELINNFSVSNDIIALKVTTIKERDGKCPRGGEGCGVCSSLEGTYRIDEETDIDGDKDTSKLLKAGAKKVYWLRVLEENLTEGIEAFFKMIAPSVMIICESNSLRTVVQPGVFLMVQKEGSNEWKHSAKNVKHLAHEIVIYRDLKSDFNIDKLKMSTGKWSIK